MDCREASDLLSADVDGELAPIEAESLRLHLRGCEACARKRAALEDVRRAYRSIAQDVGGADVPRTSWRWTAAAALFAAVMVASLWWTPAPRAPEVVRTEPPPGWLEGRQDLAIDCGQAGPTTCPVATPHGIELRPRLSFSTAALK